MGPKSIPPIRILCNPVPNPEVEAPTGIVIDAARVVGFASLPKW